MAKRHKEWARKRRALLVEVLGNHCAMEGDGPCRGILTIDCKEPRGHKHHKMDASARQSFYHRQLRENNLQLLCERHQALKSKEEKPVVEEEVVEQPNNNCPF